MDLSTSSSDMRRPSCRLLPFSSLRVFASALEDGCLPFVPRFCDFRHQLGVSGDSHCALQSREITRRSRRVSISIESPNGGPADCEMMCWCLAVLVSFGSSNVNQYMSFNTLRHHTNCNTLRKQALADHPLRRGELRETT